MSAGPSGNGAAASEASLLAWIAAARAWIFLIFLVVFFEIWARSTYGNSFIFNTFTLRAIGMAAVVPLLLALGQTLVIISGGIDLSVGFTMGLAAVTAATIIRDFSPIIGLELALLFGIVAGLLGVAIPGLINGLLIGRLRIPPFIGTLGMFGVARGIGYLIADGTTVPARNEQLTWLGNGLIYGIPVPVIITAFVVLGFHPVAVADPVRPIHLCHRRQSPGGKARRYQRQAPHHVALCAIGGLGRAGRSSVHGAVLGRRSPCR